MNNTNRYCTYFCEGEDDLKLVDALKYNPSKIISGSSRRLNVVQELIPKSVLLKIRPYSKVALNFDSDVTSNLSILKRNIANIERYCQNVGIVYLLQVKNLEDELVRCSDVKNVLELTHSKTLSNFKRDFARMKVNECRYCLDRHSINVNTLWNYNFPTAFDFVERNSKEIKNI